MNDRRSSCEFVIGQRYSDFSQGARAILIRGANASETAVASASTFIIGRIARQSTLLRSFAWTATLSEDPCSHLQGRVQCFRKPCFFLRDRVATESSQGTEFIHAQTNGTCRAVSPVRRSRVFPSTAGCLWSAASRIHRYCATRLSRWRPSRTSRHRGGTRAERRSTPTLPQPSGAPAGV